MYSARGKITWPARKRLSAWSPLNVSCCQYLSFRKPYHTPRILQDVVPWAQTWAATVSRSTVVLLTHCISGNKGLVTSDYLHTFIYSYAHVTMVNFCIKTNIWSTILCESHLPLLSMGRDIPKACVTLNLITLSTCEIISSTMYIEQGIEFLLQLKLKLTVQEIPNINNMNTTQIARFLRPTWGPPRSCRPQMGPMLTPWTLLSG